MGSRRLLILAALLCMIVFVGAFGRFHFKISDQFERGRLIEEIVSEQNFPSHNFVYGFALPNIYPPLFDLLSAQLFILSGFALIHVWFILSIALVLCFFFISFLIARRYLPENYALFVGLLVVISPWVLRRILYPISESIGMLLFLAMIYFLLRKKYSLLFIFFPLIALFHARSTVYFLAFFLLYSLYFVFKKQLSLKKLLFPLAPLAIAMLWYLNGLQQVLLSSLSNPFVVGFSLSELFGFFWPVSLFCAAYFFLLKRKYAFFSIWLFGLMLYFLLSPADIGGFRTAAFAFFPLAFFLALFALNLEGIPKYLAPAAMVFFVFLAAFSNTKMLEGNTYMDSLNISALNHLKAYPKGVVATDFVESYAVPYFSKHSVVIGPFLEQLENGSERAQNTFSLISSCSYSQEYFSKYDSGIFLYVSSMSWYQGCTRETLEANGFSAQGIIKSFDSTYNAVYLVPNK